MCDNCEEKKDYSKTLNLPKTDFPMRGNLPENEPKIKEKVFDKGLYEKMLKKNEDMDFVKILLIFPLLSLVDSLFVFWYS